MKLILDIKDDKAPFILELLQNFKFVTARPFSQDNENIIESLNEAVEEMNQIKQGKKQSQSLKEFLNEL